MLSDFCIAEQVSLRTGWEISILFKLFGVISMQQGAGAIIGGITLRKLHRIQIINKSLL